MEQKQGESGRAVLVRRVPRTATASCGGLRASAVMFDPYSHDIQVELAYGGSYIGQWSMSALRSMLTDLSALLAWPGGD